MDTTPRENHGALIGAWLQIALFVAVLVMWWFFHVPLGVALGHGVIIGMGLYTILGLLSTFALSMAGVSPRVFLLAPAVRVLSIVLLAVLWYLVGLVFWKAFLLWLVAYVVIGAVAKLLERRFLRQVMSQQSQSAGSVLI